MARNVLGSRSIRARGCVMAAGLLPRSHGFVSKPVRVEIVMEKATLGAGCVSILAISPVTIIRSLLHTFPLSTTDVADGVCN
jgi:hypothetical protein